MLDNLTLLENPIPSRGSNWIWDLDESVAQQVQEELLRLGRRVEPLTEETQE